MLFFSSIKEKEIGEKAYKIALLSQNRFNVPLGFIVQNDSDEDILDAYLALGGDERLSSLLQEEEVFVAIRSADFGKKAVFVKGRDAVLEAVKESKRLWKTDIIVQKLIPSQKSGNAKINSNIEIKAIFGLKEDEDICPDVYILDKDTLEIKAVKISEKRYAYFLDEDIEKHELLEKSKHQVLIEKEMFEIARLLKRIKSLFGKPQEIEWGIYKDKIYIYEVKEIEEKVENIKEHPFFHEEISTKISSNLNEDNREEKEIEIIPLDIPITNDVDIIKEEPKKQENQDFEIKELDDTIFSTILNQENSLKEEKKEETITIPKINIYKEMADLNCVNIIFIAYLYVKDLLIDKLKKYQQTDSDNFNSKNLTALLEILLKYERIDDILNIEIRKIDKAYKDFINNKKYPEIEDFEIALKVIKNGI